MMQEITFPSSDNAHKALTVLTNLQERFRQGIDQLSVLFGDRQALIKTTWLRDQGSHGGGWRWENTDAGILNRGSLNISSVHYDDLPDKRLSSATALSCIIHPKEPRVPSLHTHLSWTELRSGEGGGWRLMADLNPSSLIESDRDFFVNAIDEVLSSFEDGCLDHAKIQGDQYFWIPALNRHRGVAHYYIEQWKTDHFISDLEHAKRFGERVIDTYLNIVECALRRKGAEVPQSSLRQQLDYHSLYFLQVLTLDRGTSSGILVHQQNDEGIMGSLPQRVDRALLRSWISQLPKPQDRLLSKLCEVLTVDESRSHLAAELCTLDASTRCSLAQVVREHYQVYPEALALQARGAILPPTVVNHSSK